MMYKKLIPYNTAYIVLESYIHYHAKFKKITRRAKLRFENKDWEGIQIDMRERSLLYRNIIDEASKLISENLQNESAQTDEAFWIEVKRNFFDEIKNLNTRNIAETFYNSVYRHTCKNAKASAETMFVHSTGSYREFKSIHPIFYSLDFEESIESTIEKLISLYPFDIAFENIERDIKHISDTIKAKLEVVDVHWKFLKIEVLRSVFYRNKAAYLIGKLYIHDTELPFILPLLHQKNGIFYDTALLDFNAVSSILSYHRSYFLVDVDIVSETVDFLKDIFPTKGLGEIYNSIGFEKHGKTVFYRDFKRHLIKSVDKFDVAPGVEGMVMLVFDLPSYNMVFKIIKDRFEAPKKITQEEVKEKYRIVNLHDRVGRMTDAHVFENLIFDKRRFQASLVKKLLRDAPSKIEIEGNYLKIKHLYVEKKMTPLNLYLDSANDAEKRHAVDEYGKAIKELAAANIFPGDLLLKNFGVTRLKRVVFYDYDEIGFLTEYNFRDIPAPRNDYEEMSSEPYYHVGHFDIFPEEFVRFLFPNNNSKKIFQELHGDLYTSSFWKTTQNKIKNGEIIDVFPYGQELRFKR